jgi:hypothetical protein
MGQLEKLTKKELIEIIKGLAARVAELEVRLGQNSQNSQSRRAATGRANRPLGRCDKKPDEIVEVEPMVCNECGADLTGEPMFHSDTRYVYDVMINVSGKRSRRYGLP